MVPFLIYVTICSDFRRRGRLDRGPVGPIQATTFKILICAPRVIFYLSGSHIRNSMFEAG